MNTFGSLQKWLQRAAVDDGTRPGQSRTESAELRGARKRVRLLEQAVHDDLAGRQFTAEAPNQLWLTDINDHRTAEGKYYLRAVKDVFSNKIVGYSIDSRMKARLAVNALENVVAMRGEVAGCVIHSDRGSQFRSREFLRTLTRHPESARRRCRRHGERLQPAAEERPQPPLLGHPSGACGSR